MDNHNNINFNLGEIPPYFHPSDDEEEKINENSGLTENHGEASQPIAGETKIGENPLLEGTNGPISQSEIPPDQEKVTQLISQHVQNNTLLFQQAYRKEKKITLAEAKNLIQTSIENRRSSLLCALNLLFIDTMKVMQELGRDSTILLFRGKGYSEKLQEEEIRGDEIIHLLTVELHLIFRTFREYLLFYKGKTADKAKKEKIAYAQKIYTNILNLYSRLECISATFGTLKTKNLCHQLKQYCDVLYYLCENEDLLKECSQSLSEGISPEKSLLIYPPCGSHMQLYLDSLNICLFSSMVHFQKSDCTKELKQAIANIKGLPKVCFDCLPLKQFINSIQQLNTRLDTAIKTLKDNLKPFEKIVVQLITNKANQQLQACFQCLESENLLFLKTIEEMLPLTLNISTSWKAFHENLNKLLDQTQKQFIKIYNEIEQSIKPLRKALKNSKNIEVKKHAATIEEQISSIEQHSIFDRLNACIVESTRIPLITSQDMAYFFEMMKKFNQIAGAFHQSLFISSSKIPPCASFSPIDLLIHRIFQFVDQRIQENDAFNDTPTAVAIGKFKQSIELLEMAGQVLMESQERSILMEISGVNKSNALITIFNSFAQSVADLKKAFNEEVSEQEALKICDLKTSLHLLSEYLTSYVNPRFSITLRHFTCTLLAPFRNQSDRISADDLPLIQNHIHLIDTSISQRDFNQSFVELECATKKRLEGASAKGIFFWKLNLKCVILAKLWTRELQKISQQCNQKLRTCNNEDEALLILHKYGKKLKSLNEKETAFQFTVLANLAKNENYLDIYAPLFLIMSRMLWISFLESSILDILTSNPAPKKPLPLITSPQIQFEMNSTDTESTEEEKSDLEERQIEIDSILPKETYLPSDYEENLGIDSILPKETYRLSDYEESLRLLNTLKGKHLPFLNDQESIESFILRTNGRNTLIQNIFFYLTLIEEGKKGNPLRGQFPYLLLLEATEKIALLFSKKEIEEFPNLHILSLKIQQRPLIYTHNGEFLVKLLHSVNPQWLKDQDIQSSIQRQEFELKSVYWLQEDPKEIPNIAIIPTRCQKVWKDLTCSEQVSKPYHLYDQAMKFQDYRSQIHEFKRNQLISLAPLLPIQNADADLLMDHINSLISSLQINPQCSDLIKYSDLIRSPIRAIKRILDFSKILSACENKEQMALSFVTDSAAMQIAFLSSILILALSTVKTTPGQPHPLFLNQDGLDQGRPLFHTHEVVTLWNVLKGHLTEKIESDVVKMDVVKMLDTYLPLFVGDPRYPYPNKTTMTKELVHMYERVYLLRKIESGERLSKEDKKILKEYLKNEGRLSSEDKKILNKYLKNERRLSSNEIQQILKKGIAKAIEHQKVKNQFALELAESILKQIT